MAKTKTSPAKSTTGQVARFGLVGVLNTVIDYVIFIGISKIFAIPIDSVWKAKLVSGSIAMVNSFYFNRTFVFKNAENKNQTQQFARFIISTVISVYVIQLGLVQFFTSVFPDIGQLTFRILTDLGISGLIPHLLTEAFVIKTVAFGLATLASLTWNFVLYKLWAFKE